VNIRALPVMHVIGGYVALKHNVVTVVQCTHLAMKVHGQNGGEDLRILKTLDFRGE
jgi:hypothetical protein